MEQQNEQKKSRKFKLFALLIVLLLVAFGSYKLISKPNEKSKGKDAKVETKESEKYDQATLELQDALEGIRKLFDNGKLGTTRAGITPEELKDVKAKIDKLEDGKVKEDLLSEYERIQKDTTGSTGASQELGEGEQEQVYSE
ncbi:hypothetical protein [Vagococcus sp.]